MAVILLLIATLLIQALPMEQSRLQDGDVYKRQPLERVIRGRASIFISGKGMGV